MRKTNIDTEDSEMQNCTAEENNGDSEGQPDFCELGSSLKSKVQEFSRTVPNILLMQLLITRGCITILNWNDELRELFADHIFEVFRNALTFALVLTVVCLKMPQQAIIALCTLALLLGFTVLHGIFVEIISVFYGINSILFGASLITLIYLGVQVFPIHNIIGVENQLSTSVVGLILFLDILKSCWDILDLHYPTNVKVSP